VSHSKALRDPKALTAKHAAWENVRVGKLDIMKLQEVKKNIFDHLIVTFNEI